MHVRSLPVSWFSAGGGVEVAEDAENDGFTAIGYAGCAGGPFPKTDCHDNVANVFPGQTAFFDTPANSPPSNFYDYDCDTIAERRPPDATPCMDMNGRLCVSGDCVGGGLAYTGFPPCGTNVDFITCRCGLSGCETGMRAFPLPCR